MEYEEIQRGLKRLLEIPCKGIPEDEMEKIRSKIRNKCPKSVSLNDEIVNLIPGGTQHQIVIKDPFAVTMKRNLGVKMWDIDDNEYLDYLMSAGACILGHSYPPLQEELFKVLKDLDPNTYWNTEWEVKAIKAIKKHVLSIERLQYF